MQLLSYIQKKLPELKEVREVLMIKCFNYKQLQILSEPDSHATRRLVGCVVSTEGKTEVFGR